MMKKEKMGIGRRKQAIARVFLSPGNGTIVINKVSGEKYLQSNTTYLNNIWAPLKKLNLEKQFDIVALVRGGGLTGQTDAIQLGVARLICKMEKESRITLKPYGFLTEMQELKNVKNMGYERPEKHHNIQNDN